MISQLSIAMACSTEAVSIFTVVQIILKIYLKSMQSVFEDCTVMNIQPGPRSSTDSAPDRGWLAQLCVHALLV